MLVVTPRRHLRQEMAPSPLDLLVGLVIRRYGSQCLARGDIGRQTLAGEAEFARSRMGRLRELGEGALWVAANQHHPLTELWHAVVGGVKHSPTVRVPGAFDSASK